MKKFVPVFLCLLAAFESIGFSFRNGDLLFQLSGNSAFSEAISSATAPSDGPDFVHVGIAWVTSDSIVYVVEADPSEGVRTVPLQDFLDSSPNFEGNSGVVVKRISTPFLALGSVANSLQYLGEPYDWYYLPDNGMMYCTELVYESFIDDSGNKIFHALPMNFRAPDGSMPSFWIELYQKIGIDIPEGIPGTNPNQLSREDFLVEVFRFF